ncbi:DeoR/GlpR family DNA-binding transcription regulator [Vibrio sp. JC009]|uniref:transcriptional repressor AgaR n=1 Tax=Vibrio sp. JC009 TaxID=2912314 RepID=UPI0023AE7442|nr:transcriptional repressor AgaR [Vibrio sp. JC009]WED24954.1 DeoR/GlpR family DNA-binding transcription regulator [Vibrio sp. JC009]
MTITTQRREEILTHIQENGIGYVEDFARKYQVSSVTVRNDLNVLEKRGCIVRCYGGATINKHFAFDRSLKEKGLLQADLKSQIAKKAVDLIQDGDSIILDSGSTTDKIAQQLPSDKALVVMTNALNIAYRLTSYENIEVMITGGTVRKNAFSLHGENAEEQLAKYRFDKLFLGVDGFDMDLGITTPHKGEALVNRAMCKVAKTIIAVCDSSKLDRKSFCIIATLEDIDVLITDSGISQHYVDALVAHGVEVIIAD